MGSVSSTMSSRPLASHPMTSPSDRYYPTPLSTNPLDHPVKATPAAGPSDLASLRAAALGSAPSRRHQSPKPSSLGSQAGRDQRGMSFQTAIGVPMSKVDVSDKEEGEISDEEEVYHSTGPLVGRSDLSHPVDFERTDMLQDRQVRMTDPYGRGRPSKRRASSPRFSPTEPEAGPSNHATRDVNAVTSQHSHRPSTFSISAPTSIGNTTTDSMDDGDLAAPSDISPEDAQKYMDIIRKLLQGGYSPDLLVKRGATAKYITAVCEEIVEGTKRRKALWLGPSSVSTSTPPSLQSEVPNEVSMGGSPSSEVEVLVSTHRRGSMSSEGSAEFELIEKPSPSPPRPRRLLASSHWAPPQPLPSTSSAPPLQPSVRPPQSAPNRPIIVESYKPAQQKQSFASIPPAIAKSVPVSASTTTLPVGMPMSLPPATSPRPIPNAPFPASLNTITTSPVVPARTTTHPEGVVLSRPVPTEPRRQKQKKGKKGKRSKDDIDSLGPSTLNYEDEEPMLLDPPVPINVTPKIAIPATVNLPPRPSSFLPPAMAPSGPSTFPAWFSKPNQPNPSSLPARPDQPRAFSGPGLPERLVQKADPQIQADIDAREAILAAKRKVLESMKLRKKTTTVEPATEPLPLASTSASSPAVTIVESTPVDISRAERTIEEEMLNLEQEVLSLQKEVETAPMDIDEPEEGEITPSSLPLPLPSLPVVAFPTPSSLPNMRRGVKRPNAEDLDAQPTTAQARPRRKPFGGPPIKPSRLMLNLDEQSDSDSEDEERRTLVIGLDAVMREKELQIRLLKEKIAARMREKAAKKAQEDVSSAVRAEEPAGEPAHATAAPGVSSRDEGSKMVVAILIAASDFRIVKGDVESEPTPDKELPMLAPPVMSGQLAALEPQGDRLPAVRSVLGTTAGSAPSGSTFAGYRSLMGRYPQLTATTHAVQSFPQFKLKQPTLKPTADVFKHLDRHLLCSIILTHRLAENPHAMICPAEAGGGICADSTCDALHLDKGDPEASDWVEYLVQSIAADDDGKERARVDKAVRQAMKTRAKGKGKPLGPGRAEVMNNTLASESALTMFLGKIGEAYQLHA